MKLGERFYIHNLKETIAYEVDQILVVEPSNFSDLLIVPGHDYATLLTCTPIMINTHRLLVRGHRVPYDEAIDDTFILSNKTHFKYKYMFMGDMAFIVLMLLMIYNYKRKTKRYVLILKNHEDKRGDGNE